MPDSHSPRTLLDHEQIALRDNVVTLSSAVDHAIETAVQALKDQDVALCRQIIKDDAQINALRFQVERDCFRLLALQQPTARDLRMIVTAIHIVVELERMGDHAEGIAKLGLELAQAPLLKPLIDIPRMADICRDMLRDSVSAYLNQDVDLAKSIIARDDEVDNLDEQIYRELLTFMISDPHTIMRATHLLWVSHNLERIADRITNICERVVFMVTGELSETQDHV